MSGNVNPPTTVARLGTSGGPFCQAAHTGANQVNPATSARYPFRRRGVPRQITRPAAIRASPAARLSAAPQTELPAYVVARPGPSATASAPAPAASPNSPAAMRAGVASRGCASSITRLWHRRRHLVSVLATVPGWAALMWQDAMRPSVLDDLGHTRRNHGQDDQPSGRRCPRGPPGRPP